MDIQTLEIRLPDDLLKQIDARARQRGVDRNGLILEWIAKGQGLTIVDGFLDAKAR
jgi:hypothetical protein